VRRLLGQQHQLRRGARHDTGAEVPGQEIALDSEATTQTERGSHPGIACSAHDMAPVAVPTRDPGDTSLELQDVRPNWERIGKPQDP